MSEPLTAAQRVAIARHPQRPNITDYNAVFGWQGNGEQ